MILHAFGPAFGEPSPSPFCVKAMCLLTMAGVDWRPDFDADIRKAPRGKFPVLIDGDKVIADSSEIAEHLRLAHGVDFDPGLSAADRARAHAAIRMAEEHLYHAVVYDRWLRDENWAVLEQMFFADLPWILRQFVPGMVRKQAIRNLKGQGLGRMPYDTVMARARVDLEALSALLGETPFLFGPRPGSADAAIAPILAAMAATPEPTALRKMMRDTAGLMAYCERVKAQIYPDVSPWT